MEECRCQIYQYADLAAAAEKKENKVPRRYLQMSLFSKSIRPGILQERLDRTYIATTIYSFCGQDLGAGGGFVAVRPE